MSEFSFEIGTQLDGALGRTGTIHTKNGDIQTPAFVTVGTAATVKAMTPEMLQDIGSQVVLANTYHLYLQPGDKLVAEAGGFGKFMNWSGPTMTDSGGFQVFSLGEAFGTKVSKVASGEVVTQQTKGQKPKKNSSQQLCTIDEEGATFRSHRDGSTHRFTPESSMEVQWNLGADMIFAFDECTSPLASKEYQAQAIERTKRWARRSLAHHVALDPDNIQALFGVVQGGRHEDLRRLSARGLADMTLDSGEQFDGFGIGGSFNKDDLGTAVRWVNEELPEDKPRHLLGIGEPGDMFLGVEHGCDLFDCVLPTRNARNGTLYTKSGPVNIMRAEFKSDFTPLDESCSCYTCTNYSRAYLSHVYRSKEMIAATLGSIHNLKFLVDLVDSMREGIHNGNFYELKDKFFKTYYGKN